MCERGFHQREGRCKWKTLQQAAAAVHGLEGRDISATQKGREEFGSRGLGERGEDGHLAMNVGDSKPSGNSNIGSPSSYFGRL